MLKRGDKVYLQRKYIKIKRFNIKLDFKKIRPFEIIKKVRLVNYQLKLLKRSRLYPIFYISLLELAKRSTLTIINNNI